MLIIEKAKEELLELIKESTLLDKEVIVTCKALSPEEAIGNPLHDDYPIQVGKEKIIIKHSIPVSGKSKEVRKPSYLLCSRRNDSPLRCA